MDDSRSMRAVGNQLVPPSTERGGPMCLDRMFSFLKWSLAVVCLRSAEPCGQVVNIHSIRCVPVKRPVRPGLVIERQVAC